MALWWIGDAVLLLVVVPAVVFLLRAVVLPARQISKTVDALADAAPLLLEDLNAVPQLLVTKDLVRSTKEGLARYGAALDQIL